MAFSRRAEELRIGKSGLVPSIPCRAVRGGLVTEAQCSTRNRSYQQNTHVCVSCPRRLCPHCITEGRGEANLATEAGVCVEHAQVLVAVGVNTPTRHFGKFTPSEESLQKEQNRPAVSAGCGALNDHSLINYQLLIEG